MEATSKILIQLFFCENSIQIIALSFISEMNSKESVKIYPFYYEPQPLILADDNYVPVWAGKNNKADAVDFIGDDTGENISAKNKYYSELTGLFWIWKNRKSELVGSCHYRRYFTNVNEPYLYKIKRFLYYPAGIWKKRFGLIYTTDIDYWKSRILRQTEISEVLKKYDAIMPLRRKLKYTVETHYKRYHNIEDLRLIDRILNEKYPEYVKTYKQVLAEKRLFANNMFILRWEAFDQLMTWLFSILFEFETEINIADYKGYQERIFGFLSERLITLWVYHNKLNYKELPLVYFKKLKPASNA